MTTPSGDADRGKADSGGAAAGGGDAAAGGGDSAANSPRPAAGPTASPTTGSAAPPAEPPASNAPHSAAGPTAPPVPLAPSFAGNAPRGLPAHLAAIAPKGAHVAGAPAASGTAGHDPAPRVSSLIEAGFRREFAVPRTIPVMVREGTTADWADIWPFFKKILAAGETMCLPNIMLGSDARTLWFGGVDTEVIVAVDPRDKPAIDNPDTPILGRVIGTASTRTARDGHGRHVLHAAFAVDPVFAGQGVERELAISVLSRAKTAGYRSVEIGPVVASDTAVIETFESLGWVIIGTVPEGFEHPVDGLVGLHRMYRAL